MGIEGLMRERKRAASGVDSSEGLACATGPACGALGPARRQPPCTPGRTRSRPTDVRHSRTWTRKTAGDPRGLLLPAGSVKLSAALRLGTREAFDTVLNGGPATHLQGTSQSRISHFRIRQQHGTRERHERVDIRAARWQQRPSRGSLGCRCRSSGPGDLEPTRTRWIARRCRGCFHSQVQSSLPRGGSVTLSWVPKSDTLCWPRWTAEQSTMAKTRNHRMDRRSEDARTACRPPTKQIVHYTRWLLLKYAFRSQLEALNAIFSDHHVLHWPGFADRLRFGTKDPVV